jgi:cell division ATPase FtsA
MFGLGKHGPDGRYGLVVDIGSASVGVAIVASDPLAPLPSTVWSHREWVPQRSEEDLIVTEKHLKTALVNAILAAGQSGLVALSEHEAGATITHVTTAISAPWSYTISKTVHLKDDTPFSLTPKVIEALSTKATRHATEVLKQDEIAAKLDLTTISDQIIHITANGYTVATSEVDEVSAVSLTMLTGLARTGLIKALTDTLESVVPNATRTTNTFMETYYRAVRRHTPNLGEVCLVDVTAEATEIGIVRAGVLRYTTHIPVGYHTLARHTARETKVTFEEARGAMRDVDTEYSPMKPTAEAVPEVENAYEQGLAELFAKTGDQLSIPKTIFLHTDQRTEGYFAERIKRAAHQNTGLTYGVRPLTSRIFGESDEDDTALLLSGYVFHHRLYEFSYLHGK